MFVNNHYAEETPLRSAAGAIIDLFEDILDKNDISIPDDYRQGDPDESRIFGETYYTLEDSIVRILERLATTTLLQKKQWDN